MHLNSLHLFHKNNNKQKPLNALIIMNKLVIKYRVDLYNRISEFREISEGFIRPDMPPPFSNTEWEGENLMSLVGGEENKIFFQVLLQRVRIRQQAYEYRFRCDSRGIARFMRMKLTPEPNNFMRFDVFLDEETQGLPDIRFYQGDTDSMKRCFLCNRLKSGHKWVDVKEENIFHKDTITTWAVDYAVCPDCIHKLP